jgi:hypothetical protein
MNSQALTIFFLGMIAFFFLKPQQFYNEEGKLKTWHHINLDRPETLYNIYVFAIGLAIAAHFIAKNKK